MKNTQTPGWIILSLIFLSAVLFARPGLRLGAAGSASVKVATVFTTITVDTTADDVAVNGNCTLREAIIAANTGATVDACVPGSGTNTIAFAIPGDGPHTIAPTSPLPEITAPVIIDGTTQPGASCTTPGGLKIELNGENAGGSGLVISAGSSTIRGLVINRFSGEGVILTGNGGNTLTCNYIGTNVAGTAALGNGNGGLMMEGAGHQVGGTSADSRNLISGNDGWGILMNSSQCRIEGNFIGTDVTGLKAVPNRNTAILTFPDRTVTDNVIGGTAAGAGNLISGNLNRGIHLWGARVNGNRIEGNLVGTDVTGKAALGNAGEAIIIEEGSNNVVGGTNAAARNIVSGNNGQGVVITEATATGNQVQGNYIGVDITGKVALGNQGTGVVIENAPGNLIGGTAAGARNVVAANFQGIVLVSPNAKGNRVEGNYVGTDVTGTVALSNVHSGISVGNAPGNVIGGTTAGAGNLISGNRVHGVDMGGTDSTGNRVEGNLIGTDSSGMTALPNGREGIRIEVATDNIIGGIAAGARNVISGNNLSGIILGVGATRNRVEGNFIGTNISGTAAVPNNGHGVWLGFIGDAPNNTIGGTTAGAGNLISGNQFSGIAITGAGSSGNKVQGNYMGTDVTGTLDLGNAGSGIYIEFASNISIGGTSAGAGNLISGNKGHGMHLRFPQSTGSTIQGNYIGTNAAGLQAIPNSLEGVYVQESSNNLIGGTVTGARNLISGNSGSGIFVVGTTATGNLIQGNYIGVDVTGTAALGNNNFGVVIGNLTPNNIIGGTAAGAGNVISGNRSGIGIATRESTGNQILGNFIGTNAAGTAAIGNREIGVEFGGDNTIIGGTAPGARNIISGNGGVGIQGGGDNVTIQGNYIGTDVTGTVALPHAREGIFYTGSNGLIGGTTAAARNVISGNNGSGIGLGFTASNNRVQGNYIGTDSAGTAAVPNGGGVAIVEGAHDNLIGGTTAAERNVISGNAIVGVSFYIRGNNNTVQGNYIGVDVTGATALPNSGNGIQAVISSGNTIGGTTAGAGNRIAHNGGAGVMVSDDSNNPSVSNRILGNEIFDNGTLGIELLPYGLTPNDANDADTGPNNLQNFPVLTSVLVCSGSTIIDWTLNSTPGATFTLEFFSNAICDSSGNGEGENFIGRITATTDSNGNGAGSVTLPFTVPANSFITATATDSSGNTSEFSACRAASGNAPPVISEATITVPKGSVNVLSQVAVVNDLNQPRQSLTVQVNGKSSATVNNVTVSDLSVDSSGNVTARVSATCDAATDPVRMFTLTVTDNCGLSASSTLKVNLIPNTSPELSYNNQTIAVGGLPLVSPATGPKDNGTFIVELDKVKPKTGLSVAVDPVSGVVSITSITKADTYTIDLTITDNCNKKTSARFTVTVTPAALAQANETKRAVRNDFDGDGRSDLFTWNPADGSWRIRRSSDGKLQVEVWGRAGDVIAPADYDGDLRTDTAVWRASDGRWLIRRSSDGETMELTLGERGDVPTPGDYDGDGQADAALWRAASGAWLIWRSSDGEEQRLTFGSGDELAVPGDYDGDGKLDPALWRKETGQWLVRLSSNGEQREMLWGMNGDAAVPADYDGDGKTDLAVWYGRIGAWAVRRSTDEEPQLIWCGARAFGDEPTPGDYDGDGRADAAVRRSFEGAWYIVRSAVTGPQKLVRLY